MGGDDSGPFYCLLGGPKAGIYDARRPANTMLGAPKALLPIVVITTSRNDAETIYMLHEKLFKLTLPDDAHTMVYLLQREPATTLDAHLEINSPIYAVRFGVETGIYIGYDWSSIERYVTPPPGRKGYAPRWEGFSRLSDALIFMVKKPGANLPLVPSGAPFPPPPPRVKEVRFDFTALPEVEQTEGTEMAPPSRSASPVKSAMAPSSRAASPVKASTAAGTSASSSRISHDVDKLSSAFREMLGTTPGLDFLRRLVRPPPTMGGSVNPRFPQLILGEQADVIFMNSGLDAYEILTLLQVRVHARTVETFTHHVGLMLGWSTRDAARLWEIIKLPEV